MNITKKFDRAFQWAGEKMGAEAKTSLPDDFKMLETEMALRYDGMDRLQRSMSVYVKWIGRRGETFDDKEKGLPVSYLGRTMISHGEDFDPDSDFGNCLITLGRAGEQLAANQEQFAADATVTWLESLERNLAMMKEYQAARKKLENRRLAYDASIGKMHKSKREDFRIEEELRANKVKYEETSEDVMRRMQDIKEAEADNVRDLTHFLDAELEYHERCAQELRQIKQNWPGSGEGLVKRTSGKSGPNTSRPYKQRPSRSNSHDVSGADLEPDVAQKSLRFNPRRDDDMVDLPKRPSVGRANTYQARGTTEQQHRPGLGAQTYSQHVLDLSAARGCLRPSGRTTPVGAAANVFVDDADDTGSGGSSPDRGERSISSTTSLGSLSRTTNGIGAKKAPPPPPPSRAKKPPPIPAKRGSGY